MNKTTIELEEIAKDFVTKNKSWLNLYAFNNIYETGQEKEYFEDELQHIYKLSPEEIKETLNLIVENDLIDGNMKDLFDLKSEIIHEVNYLIEIIEDLQSVLYENRINYDASNYDNSIEYIEKTIDEYNKILGVDE